MPLSQVLKQEISLNKRAGHGERPRPAGYAERNDAPLQPKEKIFVRGKRPRILGDEHLNRVDTGSDIGHLGENLFPVGFRLSEFILDILRFG